MGRFRLSVESFFQRQMNQDEDLSLALDRMAREIKGSIFTLLTLFALVALSSHIPMDYINIMEGRLDHVNNLGGIVGAFVSHWCLGSLGVAGYVAVGLLAWLSYFSFRGIAIQDNFFRLLGVATAAVLSSIALHLIFREQFPDLSLLQGGTVGRVSGQYLLTYFNTTGALLLVFGGFLFTFILTSGLSLSNMGKTLFEARPKSADSEEEDEDDLLTDGFLAALPSMQPVRRSLEPVIEDGDDEEEEATPTPKKKATRAKRKKKAPAKNSSDDGLVLDTDDTAVIELDGDGENEGKEPDTGFQEFIPFTGAHTLPTTRLLKSHTNGAKKLSKKEVKEISNSLKEHLLSFQITGEVTGVTHGPVLTTYEYKPSAGIKLSKIANLTDDLGLVLGTRELRIMAPIPGKTVVGIEVPRPQAEVISFKDLVSDDAFYSKKLKLPISLGKGTDGKNIYGDLAAMPHLLVAGATGSGKSVYINTMIMSFLYRLTPNELRMILIDPKMLELNCFDGLPHLLTNVITKPNMATNAMNWAVEEMERRYDLMSKTGSKNIESYNSKMKTSSKKLPFIVIVVDELADLMMSGDREQVEIAITRLAQKARAAGIHLVIATQRPSTDVITGLIKANIPSRLAFKVPSAVDSRTVLDASGAQDLIGRGDSLMIRPGKTMERIHGCFVSEEELERVVKNVIGGKNHQKLYMNFKG